MYTQIVQYEECDTRIYPTNIYDIDSSCTRKQNTSRQILDKWRNGQKIISIMSYTVPDEEDTFLILLCLLSP